MITVVVQRTLHLPMLVMERLPFSLTQYIDTFKHISEADVVDVLCEIARGLVYLHEVIQVVHCDLSSNNILLTFKFCAKIADFGSAHKLDASTQMQPAPGTLAFMPPESLTDYPCYTSSLDVFSFGYIIVHMVTGKWPILTDMPEATELECQKHFISRMHDSFLLSIVKACLDDMKEKRPTSKDLLVELSERQSVEE